MLFLGNLFLVFQTYSIQAWIFVFRDHRLRLALSPEAEKSYLRISRFTFLLGLLLCALGHTTTNPRLLFLVKPILCSQLYCLARWKSMISYEYLACLPKVGIKYQEARNKRQETRSDSRNGLYFDFPESSSRFKAQCVNFIGQRSSDTCLPRQIRPIQIMKALSIFLPASVLRRTLKQLFKNLIKNPT